RWPRDWSSDVCSSDRAYGSIVGGGAHGTQLHYMRDRGDVKPGDVVVMDAATEYEGYAADITRTIPVSGKYTEEQKQIYQLVLDEIGRASGRAEVWRGG